MKDEDLIRFIEGECTAEEAAAIQRWVSADPERAALLRQLRTVWRLTGRAPQHWNVDAARKRLQKAGAGVDDVEPAPNADGRARTVARRRRYLSRWSVRTAAAVFALAAGLFWAARMSPDYPDREYTTAPGQRAELSLRDGSRVLLSVDTRLRVPRDFGEATRKVELSGQAYFVVRHDSKRPFLVQTRRGVAEDLGTAFDVRAYDHESFVQVVVAEGSVALQAARTDAGSARLTLQARDRGVIDAGGTVRRSPSVIVDDYVAWTRGALVFHNTPVDSVIAELRRWYDVDLRVESPSLGAEAITITFTMESSGEAVAALAKVLDADIVRSNGVVRLAPRRSRVRSQEK